MNVHGVVIIDLDSDPLWSDGEFIGAPAGIPAGVAVRVQIGNRRWVGMSECQMIASRTYGAASVEIVGTHSPAIADLVRFVRDRQREWADVA